MIISQTPYRISLFGGSTDYKSYYEKKGSFLIGFAMDKYCYLCVRKTPSIYDCLSKINYALIEKVDNNKDIKHNGARGVLEFLRISEGIEITHMSDLPSQTGIGSSSSFIVGLLNSLTFLYGMETSKSDLAKTAIHIERELLSEPGGIQDQIWASYGGFNSVEIDTNGDFEVKPMPVSQEFVEEFMSRCCLVYTGKTRKSFAIAEENSQKKSDIYKDKIQEISLEAYSAFREKNINKIGYLLRYSCEEKKKISTSISNSHIEQIYNELLNQNMIGGKLLGSGGAGFVFSVFRTKEDKEKFIESNYQICVDVNISTEGSIIK